MSGFLPNRRLRILLTNYSLRDPCGSELYILDVAQELLLRGHFPIVFSPALGAVAERIRGNGIPVVDTLSAIGEAPDIIHGQHHLTVLAALLYFPKVPAILVCHGWLPWWETPVQFPRILQYVAVDEACRERLVSERGISGDKVTTILNFADLRRFQPREGLLPNIPKKALLFSNYATEAGSTKVLQQICSQLGIALEVRGLACGDAFDHPENHLSNYDLIFAKGRAAIEALVSGAAVIPYHNGYFGPLVKMNNLDFLRQRNFGITIARIPLSLNALQNEIEKYSSTDSAFVTASMRKTATLERAANEFLELYNQTLQEWLPGSYDSTATEGDALSQYLSFLSLEYLGVETRRQKFAVGEYEYESLVKIHKDAIIQIENLNAQIDKLNDSSEISGEAFRSLQDRLFNLSNNAQSQLHQLKVESLELHLQLSQIQQSFTIGFRNLLSRLPFFHALTKLLKALLGFKPSTALPSDRLTERVSQ